MRERDDDLVEWYIIGVKYGAHVLLLVLGALFRRTAAIRSRLEVGPVYQHVPPFMARVAYALCGIASRAAPQIGRAHV